MERRIFLIRAGQATAGALVASPLMASASADRATSAFAFAEGPLP